MKALYLHLFVGLLLSSFSQTSVAQTTQKEWSSKVQQTPNKKIDKKSTTKKKDNIDDRMKGPNGEKIYIGKHGGRFYYNDKQEKVYVAYHGKKKKSKSAKK